MLFMKTLTPLILIVLLLSACNDTPRSIRQSDTYRKVTNHYKKDDNNKRRKAAAFLFKNMSRHHTYVNDEAKAAMDSCTLAFSHSPLSKNKNRRKNAIEYVNKCIKRNIEEGTSRQDIDHLTSKFLINNIDFSYNAWEKTRNIGQIDFQMFCNYILPYRVANEPIDMNYTSNARRQYMGAIDSLNDGADFISIARHIILKEDIKLDLNKYPYNYIFSRQQTSKLRGVNTCNDAIVYFAMLFRDLGIPATFDYTRRCYRDIGHSMLALYWQGEWHSIEVPDATLTKKDTKKCLQSFPKVFRAAYSNTKYGVDVTADYTLTVQLSLKDKNKEHHPTIAIFDNEMSFYILNTPGKKEGKNYTFEHMGADAIYALGYTHNNTFNPTRIVYVDSLGRSKELRPNIFKTTDVTLHRKYFQDKRQFPHKYAWKHKIKGLNVEGANDISFKNCDTLFQIQLAPPPYMSAYTIKNNKKYKYVKVRNETKLMPLAEFHLFSTEGKVLEQKQHIIMNEFRKINRTKASLNHDLIVYKNVGNIPRLFDSDGLSSVILGKKGFVMYVFAEPQGIGGFLLQPRNDENHIMIGDDYELLMWNRGWVSLGRQVAQDHKLLFQDVPSNGLYWLHNYSRGKEEYPFIISAQGEQYWVGQYVEEK